MQTALQIAGCCGSLDVQLSVTALARMLCML